MKRTDSDAPSPCLVDEHQGAAVMGVSFWTFRQYTTAGLIPVVAPPSPLNPGRRLRRKLVDLRDIEKFIQAHKTQPSESGRSEKRVRAMPTEKPRGRAVEQENVNIHLKGRQRKRSPVHDGAADSREPID